MTLTEAFFTDGAILEIHFHQGEPLIACLIEMTPGGLLFYLGTVGGVKPVKCFVPMTSIRMLKNTDLLTLPKGEAAYMTYPKEGGVYP